MPCEFCDDDGDESKCWNCSREPHDPRPVTPPDGSPYYESKAPVRTRVAVAVFLAGVAVTVGTAFGVLVRDAGKAFGWW